jgi:hypothetical protein
MTRYDDADNALTLDSNAASRTMAVRRHASVSDTLRW